MNRLLQTALVALTLGASMIPAQAQLYVVDAQAGTVSEYDAETGATINASLISGLKGPCALAVAGNLLYVTYFGETFGDGGVGVYNAATGAPINSRLVTGLAYPQGVAVSGGNLFVTSLDGVGTGMVGKYNATTGEAINAAFVSRLRSPMAISATDNAIFVGYGSGLCALGKFDANTGTVIDPQFVRNLPMLHGIAISEDTLWFACGMGENGIIGSFGTDSGGMISPMHRPLIMNIPSPQAIAVSGDALFIARPNYGIVAKYNATTGEVINPQYLSGLPYTIKGIAVVPGSKSAAAAVGDTFSLMGMIGSRSTIAQIELLGWKEGYFIDAILFVLIAGLLLWALLGYLRSRRGTPAESSVAEAPPSTPPGRGSLALMLIGLGAAALLTLALVGYCGYQYGFSSFLAKLNQLRAESRRQAWTEQNRLLPPAPPAAPILREVQPAVLVDPDNYKTENNWLASIIGTRLAGFAHLALHPDETSLPDIKVQAQVKTEEHQVHLDITGFSNDPVSVDLQPDFAWDPQGYAPLATRLLGTGRVDASTPSDSLPDEVATLLALTGPSLAHEDVTLSGLLQKHPAWAAAHEDAALLLVAMALRDQAGQFTDYRPALCRATAHLALAQALRGTAPATWPGEIADAGIRALSGREVDALARLTALGARPDCPDAAKPWIAALTLRAKDDWRVSTPDANSPLLLKIAWFQVLNDNLTALGATRRLEQLGAIDDAPDWGHAALTNKIRGAVETGNEFCQSTTAADIHELGVNLQIENVAPDSTLTIGKLLADPLGEQLEVGQPPALKIIGPDMFKDFARRHLLNELTLTYFWLRDSLGEPDEARKFESGVTDGFAGMRGLELLGFFAERDYSATAILHEVAKHHVTLGPWEFSNAALPGNPNLADIHPDIDTLNDFYQDGVPFGTAYDLRDRSRSLYIGSGRHKAQSPIAINFNLPTYPYAGDLAALNPSSYFIFSLAADRQHLFENSQPWWAYNLQSIMDVEKRADSLDDADYTTLLEKHAALEPDAYFTLGKRLRAEGKDDAAADADRKGFDQALDQVAMSNSVGPLVDYYYDHNRKDEAEMVARKAADIYSERGLLIYSKLLEKMGRFPEAEQYAQAIADRYNDHGYLDELYAAHPDAFPARNKALLDQNFPNGLEKAAFASFTAPPTDGVVYTSDSNFLQSASLQVGDVVVAMDGYRVRTSNQYDYIRGLSTDPHMDLVIWRQNHYLEVHAATPPDRKFQVDMQDYTVPSK